VKKKVSPHLYILLLMRNKMIYFYNYQEKAKVFFKKKIELKEL